MLFFLLALMPLNAQLQASWLDSFANYFRKSAPATPPTIKVLIVHDRPGVVVEVKGKYKIYDPHSGSHISTRYVGKRKFIQAVRDGIKWGEEFPGVHQLLIVPDEKETTSVVDGIEYKGLIYVYDIGGAISVVNQIPIEEYLSSILIAQYRQPLPEELLNAIAIAARTAAYYRSDSPKSEYWSVDGRQVGYYGYAAARQTNAMEKAIRDTRYMVMSHAAPNEDRIRPFSAEWKQPSQNKGMEFSQISLQEAENMADNGAHAAQILARAFPGVKIELIHYASDQ